MNSEAYEKLIPALNARSTMLPAIKCDEFFDMISFLFTPEEAEIAATMPFDFASAEEISASLPGSNAGDIHTKLEKMADKGIIHSKRTNGTTVYEFLPFFPGIMELQFYKTGEVDYLKQLDNLMRAYNKALRNMVASGNMPKIDMSVPARKVFIDKELYGGGTILPYKKTKELIENTEYIAAGTCHCRHSGEYLDKPCSRPMNNCMILGTSAKFTTDRGLTRRLTKEQALQILDEAEASALVHNYSNTPDHFSNILCNCCSCHCFILRGWNKSPAPSSMTNARYLIRIDTDACIDCEACIDRCQTKALKMEEGKLSRDELRCIGCGLCMYVCPTDALSLEPRPAAKIPLKPC